MAASATSCFGRLLSSLLVLLLVGAPFYADGATTSAEKNVPEWASNNALQLTLSTKPGLQFTTIPLTENLGLNESQSTRGIISIPGELRPVNVSNYNEISGSRFIAYLPCDKVGGGSSITPDKMLNDLMSQKPKAIVLYSTSRNWCSITSREPLSYTSILTMADAGEASNVLSYLSGSGVEALVQGNATEDQSVNESNGGGGNNSAVAMSILYSITGLITLLFLIIIATGAIRAHRYPERYGPRGAVGGRPRQSRAKGLARAVLDTIPIVKFGSQQPSDKADPEVELEPVSTSVATQQSTKDRRVDVPAATASRRPSCDTKASTANTPAAAEGGQTEDGHLGCSICTEDFKVGEDVRVLPCNHQFHPNCVDPWLVNVSGTCPLCRLDLRPGQGTANQGPAGGDGEPLPPPLVLEGEDGHGSSTSQGNRFARLLDINRLRQAPVEERIETLRQMRAQTNENEPQDGEGGERPPHGARLTKKLKEKFRIRTRAQLAGRRPG
ncbi:hypothetical protein G6O67_002682 [Ophiocordyceps sinensis]|uniref:RING-type E3 ubiquitin transferase n=1 Tax=Ophiocordyceps sinensis TaxID=72228 RepID=A0A8H4PUR1_9HYPO|nr:hypothetical protein G6O67_002682 [Ophiocordyceps sinensis]